MIYHYLREFGFIPPKTHQMRLNAVGTDAYDFPDTMLSYGIVKGYGYIITAVCIEKKQS